MDRDDVLALAQAAINGERQKDYGDWDKNAELIAAGWSLILGVPVPPRKVPPMQDWVKTARLIPGNHADSWVDKAGYSALGGEYDSND